MTSIGAQITTLEVKAPSYDLVDLATLKILLAETSTLNDAFYALAISQASTAAANYCNRTFNVETLQSQFWPQRDGWPGIVRGQTAVLQLPRWPLVSVTSMFEAIANVPTPLNETTDFVVDYTKGQITRLDRNGLPRAWATNPIAITYLAGYPTIPLDVVDATARLVKAALYARTRDPMLRSEHADGIYEAAYWFGSGPGSTGGMAPDIVALLDNYRVPVIG